MGWWSRRERQLSGEERREIESHLRTLDPEQRAAAVAVWSITGVPPSVAHEFKRLDFGDRPRRRD